MKLRCVSDLHHEFYGVHQSAWEATAQAVAGDDEYDVLVVAGDVSNFSGMRAALTSLCRAAVGRPVVYVPGNHEAYGSSIPAMYERAHMIAAESWAQNLHVLTSKAVNIVAGGESRKFVGTTLWYKLTPALEVLGKRGMGDFAYITSETSVGWDIDNEAREAEKFLRAEVEPGCVVVTHFMPHPRSIHPMYANSGINGFFLHDVSDIVERGGAAAWIHGHTHSSFDYVVGSTRVVCNPHGYITAPMPNEPNSDFEDRLTVIV